MPKPAASPITSPLARALIGKKKGTSVVVAPGGAKAFEIARSTSSSQLYGCGY